MKRLYYKFIYPILSRLFNWSYVTDIQVTLGAKYEGRYVEPVEPFKGMGKV